MYVPYKVRSYTKSGLLVSVAVSVKTLAFSDSHTTVLHDYARGATVTKLYDVLITRTIHVAQVAYLWRTLRRERYAGGNKMNQSPLEFVDVSAAAVAIRLLGALLSERPRRPAGKGFQVLFLSSGR